MISVSSSLLSGSTGISPVIILESSVTNLHRCGSQMPTPEGRSIPKLESRVAKG